MLNLILKVRWAIGIIAILICAWAWYVDIAGITYVCPFCRMQRTVIGILGVFLMLPIYGHWITRYLASTIGFFGAVVASIQHFRGWAKVSAKEFEFHQPLYFDSFLLSGAALFIISALVFLLWLPRKKADQG